MAELKTAKIYRGGVTAQYLRHETRECSFHANTKDRALDFRFILASKGGGRTSVLLQIGVDDLPLILQAIATKMPEHVGILSECAAIANKRVVEQLKEARRVQNDEKARAQSLVDKLETVEEFVSEKYYQAPAGDDDREALINDHLEEVLSTLRSLL